MNMVGWFCQVANGRFEVSPSVFSILILLGAVSIRFRQSLAALLAIFVLILEPAEFAFCWTLVLNLRYLNKCYFRLA
jgi:hypothetical protein